MFRNVRSAALNLKICSVKEKKFIKSLQSRERLGNQYGCHKMLQMKSVHATITDMDFVCVCVSHILFSVTLVLKKKTGKTQDRDCSFWGMHLSNQTCCVHCKGANSFHFSIGEGID